MSTPDSQLQTLTGPLRDDLIAAVTELAERVTQVDGVAPLGESPLRDLTSKAEDAIHVVVTAGGDSRLLGYGQLDPSTFNAELVVDPDMRGLGMGNTIIATLQEQARDRGGVAKLWAHGDLVAAQMLAATSHLERVRELWHMSIPLTPQARHEFGAAKLTMNGVAYRLFVPGQDEEAVAYVNKRAFVDHPEQSLLSAADIRERTKEPWFDANGFFLVEDTTGESPKLLGFCWTKIIGDEGEIYVLGVDPQAQGKRLGTALTAKALNYFIDKKLARAILYVEGNNERAIRTYLNAGLTRTAVDVQYA